MSEKWPAQRMSTQNNCDGYDFLLPEHIQMIDEALCSLGEYGEVRLVIDKGRLRFLVTQKCYDTLKWRPGVLEKDLDP